MTIKKRLARSNIIMILAPVFVTFIMVLIGVGVSVYALETVYLPKLGLTLEQLNFVRDQYDSVFSAFEVDIWIYVGIVAVTVVVTIVLADQYLTRYIFKHIAAPLDQLVSGVDRIRGGDLESPIAYTEDDEFRPACEAVDLMAARLKESMERSQEEQQRRKEMFAGMSHDLRSPLTSIRAYAEALLDGAAKNPEAERRYLTTIRDKETEIEAMVEQLFAFSKLELSEYPVHTEPLRVRDELESAIGRSAPANVEVSWEGLGNELVVADRALLERIALNVLENSRKYRTGDTAHVNISSRRDGERVIIAFDDDGPGVPEEMLPKLFEAFFRADPARKNPSGGSGLGLAIVRNAAEQMNGSVWAERGKLGGLAVMLALPAGDAKGETV
jgi:signal transduction histidine kinase